MRCAEGRSDSLMVNSKEAPRESATKLKKVAVREKKNQEEKTIRTRRKNYIKQENYAYHFF
mgnify:CR=1 FL=1